MKSCIAILVLLAASTLAHADDLVVIVNAANATASLTPEQTSNLFLGKATEFPGGGAALPIDFKEGSPIREAFHSKVTKKDPAQLKAYWAKFSFTGKGLPPKEFGSNAEVKKFVATTPGAIGYIEKSAADSSVKVVATVTH